MAKFLAAVVGWLGIALAAAADSGAAPAGRLELVGTNVVEFGEYPNTEDRTATVSVRNAGAAPLAIARVFLTCKCMRVASFPKTLAPGESGEVAVTIAKNEVAGRYERIFYVEAEGESSPSVKVRIRGYARPLFLVTCDKPFALGPVDPGTVWSGRFTVAATEAGIRLGPPAEHSQGARGTTVIRTNAQEKVSYEVDRTVVFEGEGLLESALIFPILRDDGEKSLPVRVAVEAVRRRPFRVVPDRLVVAPGPATVRRRVLVSVESPEALDVSRLTWAAEPESVEVRPSLAKSGKAFLIDVYLTPEALGQLADAGGGALRFGYCGGALAEVPVALGR
jgi:hypothetical protein